MPPPLPAESETGSTAGDITPTRADPSIQADQELADAVKKINEEDDEEDDDDENGEVYVVETILNHHANFEDGLMRYQVKWKGYEKKSERTWETEDNFVGARDILEAYWEKLGGKPTPASAKAVSKKRSRQSGGGSGTPDSMVVKKQRKSGGRTTKDAIAKDDEKTPEPPTGFTEVGNDNWTAPKPVPNAWDPKVQMVDTIEKDDQGELWAYLVWNEKNDDGRFYRSKAKLMTCNKACPQRVCFQTKESHLYEPEKAD
ncbi:hypothetical protein MMC07_002419 [Pseudocyphellaria aurata]|nr:hypothetical protein [Pseudocyphellaria aurata]